MSYLKINSNLFLGSAELNRLQKFLQDNVTNRELQEAHSYGLYYNELTDPTFQNGLVEEASVGVIKINDVFAVDNSMRLIMRDETIDGVPCSCDDTESTIPDDGNYYWIRARHKYNCNEVGTVEVTTDGKLLGVDTAFTEVLRGGRDGSWIELVDSSLNPLAIQVANVVSDTEADLLGTINAESDLKYCVRGTFSATYDPSVDEKNIFQYDNCDLVIEEGSGVNGEDEPIAGSLINGEAEVYGENSFFLARVKNTAGTLEILDKRVDKYKDKANFLLTEIFNGLNPVCGIDGVTYDATLTTQDRNLVQYSWGVRALSWTNNFTTNTVSLTSIVGGAVKDSTAISNGDFDGWLCYFPATGRKAKISSSVKNGSSVDIKLDDLFAEDVEDTVQVLSIVPNVEGVEFTFTPTNGNQQGVITKYSPIESTTDKVYLPVLGDTTTYKGQYKYINHKEYTPLLNINDSEYYFETAYDENGILTTPANVKNVTSAEFDIIQSSDSYSGFKELVITGDKFGYERFWLDTANPYKTFKVGTRAKFQKFDDQTLGGNIQTEDYYINLETAGAKAGNSFTFNMYPYFISLQDPSKTFQVTQDYNLSGVPTIVYDLSDDFHYSRMNKGALDMVFIFDGTNWIYTIDTSVKKNDVSVVTFDNLNEYTQDLGVAVTLRTESITLPYGYTHYGTITSLVEYEFNGNADFGDIDFELVVNGVIVDKARVVRQGYVGFSAGRVAMSYSGGITNGEVVLVRKTTGGYTGGTITATSDKLTYSLTGKAI